ncbi:hypothetical protein L7F22_016582 [Adiantum nelumboides]|nr:hypothetical protein [Adiantum nelumboides]
MRDEDTSYGHDQLDLMGGREYYSQIGKSNTIMLKRRRSFKSSIHVYLLLILSLTIISFASTRPDDLPRLMERDYARIETLDPLIQFQDPSLQIDYHDPKSLLSKILIPRPPDTKENAKVREELLAPFRKRPNWTIEEHKFQTDTPQGRKTMTNLIVTYNVDAPRKLVLAAHHDSKVSPKGFIGATDSAVPCAIIVDVALAVGNMLEQQTSKHERGKETGLQLIFFDGEEAYVQWTQKDSLYGSRALADGWTKSFFNPKLVKRRNVPGYSNMRLIDSIDQFVLLDLLGSPKPHVPPYYTSTRWMWDELRDIEGRLAKTGALYPKDKQGKMQLPPAGSSTTSMIDIDGGRERRASFFSEIHMGFGGIDDDHRPFLQNGVPILHLIASPFPSVWHTMGDDASALDYPTIYAWTMIMRVFVAEYFGVQAGQIKLRRNGGGEEVRSSSTLLARSEDDFVSGTVESQYRLQNAHSFNATLLPFG